MYLTFESVHKFQNNKVHQLDLFCFNSNNEEKSGKRWVISKFLHEPHQYQHDKLSGGQIHTESREFIPLDNYKNAKSHFD